MILLELITDFDTNYSFRTFEDEDNSFKDVNLFNTHLVWACDPRKINHF